jgi:cell division protein FtsQ
VTELLVDDELVDVPDTRARRRRERMLQYRRRRLVGWLVLVALVLVAGGSGYLLYGTSVLGLRSVSVTSTGEPLTVELDTAVRGAVAIPTDTPLIRIDLDNVEARIRALPVVADVAVGRGWPNTLRVAVTPRVPAAVVLANSAWYLLDASGHPYDTVPMPPSDLVRLRLATPGPGDPATLAGLAVIAALPQSVVPQVATVTARGVYEVTIELTDGRTVVWGSADQGAEKARVLPAVLTRPGKVFDISDPKLITVTGS